VAARGWLLFGVALASLVLMTWAGVLLAFSVELDDAARAANPEAGDATRAIVLPANDLGSLATHAEDGEAGILVASETQGNLPSGATGVSLGRALARVAPDENGTYTPGTIELVDVPSANGTTNLTLDVAALAGGAQGFLVMGAGETEPRFVPDERVLGTLGQFASATSLWARFAVGLAGFLMPLLMVVATHRGGKRAGADVAVCGECRAPLPARASFCLRCGAYQEA